MKTSWLSVLAAVLLCLPSHVAQADESGAETKVSRLRLFNTDVFGKSAEEAVVLLRPARKTQIDPETVMVDVHQGKYFAATVRYPKKISLQEARDSLNRTYKSHEKKSFANDPEMGIWRNEDEKFSIQLTADKNNIVVIYIKFSMVTDEMFLKSFTRAMRESAEDDQED
jgi:hypothetical protein